MAAVMTGHVHALAVAELAVAGALVTWAPRLAAKLAPYALLALALFGLILAKAYHDGFSSQVLYGLVPAGGGPFRRGFVLPQAGVFFVLGMWLLLRVEAPGAGPVRALIARWLDPRRGGISARQGLLLIPVTAMALLLLGAEVLVRHAVDHGVAGWSCSTRPSPRPAWSWCSARGSGPRPWPRRACSCSAPTGW